LSRDTLGHDPVTAVRHLDSSQSVASTATKIINPRDQLTRSIMEESAILSQFDKHVKGGLVKYDQKQESIEHINGELKVSVA
jgi:hypothetical protein